MERDNYDPIFLLEWELTNRRKAREYKLKAGRTEDAKREDNRIGKLMEAIEILKDREKGE